MKEIITDNAPKAIGPYSQGMEFANFVITSGQLGIDKKTGLLGKDVVEQTRLSLENVEAVLLQSGFSLSNVVKTTVFVKDMNDFATINGVYAEFFAKPYPARSCVEVARLPKDGLVEIEVIAAK